MKKLLTIAVAAYNVEPYLEKLLDSLVTSKKIDFIEILIINGGSTDKTAEIAQKYEQRFPSSVRLINKENVGFGSTLNRGIKEAKGKYFRSLDGDDSINTKSLDDLVLKLDEIEADLILANFTDFYPDGRMETETFSGLESDRVYLFDDLYQNVKWMRYHAVIYKTSVLQENNIAFDEKCYYVDLEYDLYPIPYINTVYYFGESLYCYRFGTDGQSISPEGRKKNIDHCLTVSKSLLNFYRQEKENLTVSKRRYLVDGIADFCSWYIYSLLFLFRFSLIKQHEIRMIDNYIKDNSEEIYLSMQENGFLANDLVLLRKSNYLLYGYLNIWKQTKQALKKCLWLLGKRNGYKKNEKNH